MRENGVSALTKQLDGVLKAGSSTAEEAAFKQAYVVSQTRQTELTEELVDQNTRSANTEASAARMIQATTRQASADRGELEGRLQTLAQNTHLCEVEVKRSREGELQGKHNEQKELQ